MRYLLFIIVFLYLPLRTQVELFFSSLSRKHSPVKIIIDKDITSLLVKKTKIKVSHIKILQSKLLFGMMVGIPGFPQLVISNKLYETFSKSELEYVVLHEAGHYELWHSIKELFVISALGFIGVFTIFNFQLNEIISLLLGLLFGIITIQFAKKSEIEADMYALSKMDNRKAMISATNKFIKAYASTAPKNKIVEWMFYRGNPYENRIKMAKK